MWGALKSDLNEFVSTVAGDTSEALNRMDENFPDGEGKEQLSTAAEERLRRMEMHETFESPLISEDDPEPYKEDVKEFLADFSIDDKTDEIAKLLEENPDTLKLCFEALVADKVSYADFWERYFYRCDEDRIALEIEEEEKEQAAAREAAFQSLSSVGNLLGGAVKAAASSLVDNGKSDNSYSMTPNQSTTPGIFGASGRPPFVMNTAEDEEEDEELGWDDDDDDEDDDDNDEEEDAEDTQDQIEFNDPATEKLQEELKQAIQERDQLHETVSMQQKEIASLKTDGAESTEVKNLKTQLFEKESEIAALRASALDTSGEMAPGDASSSLVEELRAQLMEEKKALEVTKSNASALEEEAKAAVEELANQKEENSQLVTKLAEAEKKIAALEEEVTKSVDSPQTELSGVKVNAAEAVPGEEEGDWGDDWE